MACIPVWKRSTRDPRSQLSQVKCALHMVPRSLHGSQVISSCPLACSFLALLWEQLWDGLPQLDFFKETRVKRRGTNIRDRDKAYREVTRWGFRQMKKAQKPTLPRPKQLPLLALARTAKSPRPTTSNAGRSSNSIADISFKRPFRQRDQEPDLEHQEQENGNSDAHDRRPKNRFPSQNDHERHDENCR